MLIFIIIIIIAFIFSTWAKSAKGRGAIGEYRVRRIIGKTEASKQYVINNYMLVCDGKSSQIDHIVIRQNGIFVIETKNYSGRIYGNDKQLQWTQVLAYGKEKHKVYNPLKQNATHLYRLHQILPEGTILHSLIVFVQDNTKYIDAPNVIGLHELRNALNANTNESLSIDKMQKIYDILITNRADLSARKHIEEIKTMKENIANNICPRCGGRLILKTGKHGEFYGCENYPRCKFKKKK